MEVPLTVLAVFDAHAAESEPKTVSPCPAKVTVGPRANLWLVNIHRAPDGNLLGVVHVELHSGEPAANHGEEYALGLVFSQDGGERWVYCGEIVRPQDAHGNVGGAPLLVVGDYFHVSFNDQGPSGRRAAVARAPVADVLQAARRGLVTPWRKFSDGDWTQDGLTGYGAAVLAQPDFGEGHPIDLHADAAWNRALAKYMVTSWCAGGGVGRLYLHLSDDAIHFEPPILVDEEPGQWMPYSTFLTDERDHEIDDMNGPDFFWASAARSRSRSGLAFMRNVVPSAGQSPSAWQRYMVRTPSQRSAAPTEAGFRSAFFGLHFSKGRPAGSQPAFPASPRDDPLHHVTVHVRCTHDHGIVPCRAWRASARRIATGLPGLTPR